MTLNHASTSKPRPIYFSQSSYARSSMQGKWAEIKESQNLSLIIISLITHPLVNKPRAQLCQTALTIPQVRSFPLAGRTPQTIPYLDLSVLFFPSRFLFQPNVTSLSITPVLDDRGRTRVPPAPISGSCHFLPLAFSSDAIHPSKHLWC